MTHERFRIHISDFCHKLYRQQQAETGRLAENPDDVYPGYDEKPRPIDAVADFISRRTGLKLEHVHTYVHRAGHGSRWGVVKRVSGEVWPDISGIAQKMSGFNNAPDMDELLTRFVEEYPPEAAEMR